MHCEKWAQKEAQNLLSRQYKRLSIPINLAVGIYPKTLKELTEKPNDPKAASRWPGALLEKEPEDPWHEPFHYQLTPGKQHPYELFTDGDPDDADRKKIDVWEI